jgi:hypothetical protein
LGITNTFNPFFSDPEPPAAAADDDDAELLVPVADEDADDDDEDDELLDDPHAARLSAVSAATAPRPVQPRRRVRAGCVST